MRLPFCICVALLCSEPCWAGKIDDIEVLVKKSCEKDISHATAAHLVKNLFVTCVAGQKVEVEAGCQVPCMKDNSGAVVGE